MRARILTAGASALAASLAGAAVEGQLQPLPGDPLPGLTAEERARFDEGRAAFGELLTPARGLGPAFNEFSCALCHREPAAGGSSERRQLLFGRSGTPFDPLAEWGGPRLHEQATEPGALEYVPSASDVQGFRATPPLFGLGLVERIPDAELEALSARTEPNAGRVHRVLPREGGLERAGRYGWKAHAATLASFTAEALRNELGVTNALIPDELAPNGSARVLAACDRVPDPEDDGRDGSGRSRLERLADFQRFLAPPPQTPRAGMAGERVFAALGCAECHHPAFTTPAGGSAALSGVTFRPYSDFLLHDMGSFSDGIPEGAAGPHAMRTAPLWGLALRRFLGHDAESTGATAAERAVAAVLRHDGEGATARDAFEALGAADRVALLRFLGSLGRAEFDFDGDGKVGPEDAAEARRWLERPPARVGPDDRAAIADADADGDLDAADAEALELALARARERTR